MFCANKTTRTKIHGQQLCARTSFYPEQYFLLVEYVLKKKRKRDRDRERENERQREKTDQSQQVFARTSFYPEQSFLLVECGAAILFRNATERKEKPHISKRVQLEGENQNVRMRVKETETRSNDREFRREFIAQCRRAAHPKESATES